MNVEVSYYGITKTCLNCGETEVISRLAKELTKEQLLEIKQECEKLLKYYAFKVELSVKNKEGKAV